MQQSSLFNKLKTILESAARHDVESSEKLAELVRKRSAFQLPTDGSEKKYCSPVTVRRTVDLAVTLKLLDAKTLKPSDEGNSALASDDGFKVTLGLQVMSHLNTRQFGITRVLAIVNELRPPEFPDVETIYEHRPADADISEDDFRKLMHLLFLCDKIKKAPKHVYYKGTQ